MSQIFISYASEDRPWVEPFAKTLEQQGWSVWWDRQIPTGRTYDEVIWSALQEAKCVVVVWSTHSTGSEWVKEEASEAKKRNILLPVRIDEARPPFGFSRRQTQSLVDWRDGMPHRGYDQLLKDIAAVIQAPPPVLSGARSPVWARIAGYLWLIVPTLLVLMLVPVLMAWPVPTHVQVELTADRLEFDLDRMEGGWTNLLGPLEFETVTFMRFAQVTVNPKSVEVADPKQYDFEKDAYPTSAWRSVTLAQESLDLVAGDAVRHPTVTIRGEPTAHQRTSHSGGRLDSIAVSARSRITLERAVGSGTSLTAEIRAERPKATLTPVPVFQVVTRHTAVRGATVPSIADPEGMTLRMSAKPSRPTVIVEGDAGALAMTVRPLGGDADVLQGSDAVAITAIDLSKQGSTGGRVSALTEKQEATIRYPAFPDLPVVHLAAPDYLALEQLDRFAIKQLEWSSKAPGIRLVLDGIAGHVASKSGAFTRDHRLTQFDRLRQNPRLLAILAVLGWVVPTVIGARKLFKEWR